MKTKSETYQKVVVSIDNNRIVRISTVPVIIETLPETETHFLLNLDNLTVSELSASELGQFNDIEFSALSTMISWNKELIRLVRILMQLAKIDMSKLKEDEKLLIRKWKDYNDDDKKSNNKS